MSEHTHDTVACPSCGQQVPGGHYCIRCGEHLEGEGRRRGFAAAPNERRSLPTIVSTIFPQLPRASMWAFRGALAVGLVLVVVLAAFRLFPVALAAAAILVPLLTVLYLYDVDVYEDEPLRVIALTFFWGALAGAAVGFFSQAVAPSKASVLTESTATTLLVRGIGLPLLAVALMFLGPLVLLPYRRFNDVLDGATFGAAAAVAFVGAQVLTRSFSLFEAGFRPVGRVYPWIVRLLELGLAVPLIAAASIGAACGALWLRYRAPVQDRKALGLLGQPVVAVALAAVAFVLAALAQLYLGRILSLIALLVLAALTLLWLRQVIHVGLTQEAREIPVGPPIQCANCGHQTPLHTFCMNCGISLRALPKARAEEGLPPAEAPSGAAS